MTEKQKRDLFNLFTALSLLTQQLYELRTSDKLASILWVGVGQIKAAVGNMMFEEVQE